MACTFSHVKMTLEYMKSKQFMLYKTIHIITSQKIMIIITKMINGNRCNFSFAKCLTLLPFSCMMDAFINAGDKQNQSVMPLIAQ